jgi:hypothetical protein
LLVVLLTVALVLLSVLLLPPTELMDLGKVAIARERWLGEAAVNVEEGEEASLSGAGRD